MSARFDPETLLRQKLAAMRLLDPKMTRNMAFWKIMSTAFEPGDTAEFKRSLTRHIARRIHELWDDTKPETN